ncbi:MAG: ATP-dependent helicase [Bacteroidales bacterium]|nr:ATP-dependent helicase [Bacteroidales bacterium]
MQYTAQQKKALNILDKNLQIIACAGSGKTQIISQRVINILKEKKVDPSRIIAFTYTEKAAAELKARILKLCREQIPDQKGLAEMYVGTIHAWCMKVLRDNKYEFQKFSVLDEIKLKLFVDRYFDQIGMKHLNMERYKDTGLFIQLVGMIRESDFAPGVKVPDEIRLALAAYEEKLMKHCYLDFTMIMTKALEFMQNNKEFRDRIGKNIGYLIVDEYQDVNPPQEKIIEEIAKLGANICVVGDDDQTIFQWRGSDVRYIQDFNKKYIDVEYVPLMDNFRSSKGIIDVALKCILNNLTRMPKEMEPKGFQAYERGDILYNQYEDENTEIDFIVSTIKNLRGVPFKDKEDSEPRGLDFSDFAILLRKWKKADNIIDRLQAENIPFIVSGVNNLFYRPEIRASEAIFHYLQDELDADILRDHWINLSEKLEPKNIDAAIQYLDKHKAKNITYYEAFIIQEIFLDFLEIAGIREDIFEQPGNIISGYNMEEVIFYNLGMFSQIINDFETINFKLSPTNKLRNFLSFLRYSADGYYPEGWLNNSYKTPNAVLITTIYQAKGLEFPVVFIPGLNKNYLPTMKHGGKSVWHFLDKKLIKDQYRYEGSEEDERRLMYVAITRAKKFLFITRAVESKLYQKESVFGQEIRKSEFVFASPLRDFAERSKIRPRPLLELTNISLNFSLLKAFFDCPYSFKFYTFYGFQNPLGARMGYGSAIHNALMEVHRTFLEGKDLKASDLPEILDRHLNFPYATTAMVEDMTNRANKAVNIYYDTNAKDFKNILFAEKEIQIDLGDGILVNGKMDLITKKNLDGTQETTIIDFKSTEDAQAYHASIDQLQMYALGYKVLTGENADFLQIYNLDKNEGTKTELLVSDLENIKDKIKVAANEIRENHLDGTCNNPDCVCKFKKTN